MHLIFVLYFFFFFSSRRRHTRCSRDWSSDVCSSDLTRDHVGNVTLTLGQGSPKRLFTCPLDEVGYVVGNILPDGFLLLRRVGGGGAGRAGFPLFDQQVEGQNRQNTRLNSRHGYVLFCDFSLEKK